MLSPTRKLSSCRNCAHSSSSSTPLVCRPLVTLMPGLAYFFCNAIAFRKKSIPMSVGSPPCQPKLISGVPSGWHSIYWRVRLSSMSSVILKEVSSG